MHNQELDYRNFERSDEYLSKLDKFRHLCLMNLTCYSQLSCKIWEQNIKVFTPFYHRFRKLRRMEIGFDVDTNALNAMIKMIEDYFNRDFYKRTNQFRRTEANKASKKFRKLLLEVFNNTCINCSSSEDLTVDHIIPITKGGTDKLSNLQILCRSCNSIKSNKLPYAE